MIIPQISGYGNYLYPYQAYTPQFNNWNNYGYSTPIFRGAESKPIMQQPLKQDTVQISAEKEIKNKQKEGLSTGAKWAIGLATSAAAVYGCVVGHRMLTKPSIEKVAKNFSEIFRRDVSKEEALKITERYKEIFKIKDKDEFINKCFEQVKKDYGYEKLNIPLVFKNLGKATEKGQVQGHWNKFNGNIALNTEVLNSMPKNLTYGNKKHIMDTLIHEFQHVKQAEYAFRTNPTEYLNSICSKERGPESLQWYLENHRDFMRKNLLKCNKDTINDSNVDLFIDNCIKKLKNGTYKFDKDIQEMINDVIIAKRKPSQKLWSNMQKFKVGSDNYKKGLKYLEENKIYSNENMEIYHNSILEQEAFGTGTLLEEFYNFFANPWRAF